MITTKDVYTWAALYNDGSSISEYDHPDGRGFAVVDSTQVRRLTLTSHFCSHAVEVPIGSAPVFFRRRSIELQGDAQTPRPTVHCIGWKREDSAAYLFVFEDGSTLLTDNLQAV